MTGIGSLVTVAARLRMVTFVLQALSMTFANKLLIFNATFAFSNATYDCYSVAGKGGKKKKCGKTLMTTTRPLPLPPRRPSLSPPARRLSRLGLLCAAPGPHYPRLVISTTAIMTVCPTLRVPSRPSSPLFQ